MQATKLCSLIAVLLVAGLKQPQMTFAAESKDSVGLVTNTERSKHFAAVNRHLELGGDLYGYVDVDGDVQIFAGYLKQFADAFAEAQPNIAPFLKQDFNKIFEDLGFTDVKAIGLSSVQEGKLYRNRAFFYTPGGRHGLMNVLGGPAAPYVYAKLAPANADFYAEGEFDIPVVYSTIRAVIARVGGETAANMLDEQLKKAGAEAGVSALEIIQSLKGRGAVVFRFDPTKNIALPTPQPINIPAFSFLIRIDGLGGALGKALTGIPIFEVTEQGAVKFYASKMPLPIEGLQPVIAVENGALYLASSMDFLQDCRLQKAGLDKSPEFVQALAKVGPEGNGLGFVSPRFFARLRQLVEINPNAMPETKRAFATIVNQIPDVSQPLIAERINLPDGVLVRSSWSRTLKQDVVMMAAYNPVTVGFLAAMAIPAFQKVKASSQEKTIQNNLKMFAVAAQQFMLENAKDQAKYEDIVGPGKLIEELKPVAGEDYTSLVVHSSDESISVTTAAGKVITCPL
ncbi:MAG: hypothetical protein QM790_03835 [Nibricoccus sp.]